MELRHLRYFAAVAEELHFGRAAERLYIVQPALSKQIASLESELGVQLFHRTKRLVTMTEAGRALYEEVRVILQRVERATEIAQSTAAGRIGNLYLSFIGPAMWSIVPDLLAEHRRRFPEVTFHLSELSSSDQIKRLQDGTIDAAFVRLPLYESDDVDFQGVVRERFVLTVPDSHPLAQTPTSERIDFATLANERFVFVPRRVEPGFYDRCIALCKCHGFTPNIVEEGNGPTAICGMVASGLGVTLSPSSILNMPWHGIAFRELTNSNDGLELAVATRRQNPSATLRLFLDTVSDIAALAAVENAIETELDREQVTAARTSL